jgi:hypothetical protein
MDNIFGVTNNKQQADRLSGVANSDWEDFAEEGETREQIIDRLEQEDFPTFVCLDIKEELADIIGNHLHPKTKEMGEYNDSTVDTPEERHVDTPERHGTNATEDRKKEGKKGGSDDDEHLSEKEKEDKIRERLEAQGVDSDTIDDVTGEVVDHGLKYSFVERPLGGAEIFSVEPTAGAILIGLNTDHQAYDKLFSSLNLDDDRDLEERESIAKLSDANKALKLLLEAWARMEDEALDEKRHLYKDIRNDWGRVARRFLSESDPGV